ncbi:2-oxoglutarate-dependent dioxygenase 21, chloroplastic-like [Carex rostrata]
MSTATFRSLVPPLVPVKQLEPMQMPVIDLSKLYQTNKTRSLVIREIATACRDIGCFQVFMYCSDEIYQKKEHVTKVINHGIRKSVMQGALEAGSEFFESSPKSKAKFISSDITRPVRYNSSSDGINKCRSFLKHYAHPLDEWKQFWPHEPSNYRQNNSGNNLTIVQLYKPIVMTYR